MVLSKLKALRTLGLSQYETRIYFKLVEKGPMSAKQLSEEARVPYTKIYAVLSSLESKGLVKVDRNSRPHIVSSVPPLEAYLKLKTNIEQKLENLRKEAEFLQEIYEYSHSGLAQREFITIIRGEKSIVNRAISIVSTATGTKIRVAVPFSRLFDLKLKDTLIRESAEKPILVLAVKELKPLLEDLPARIEVKYLDHMFGGGIISDREVLLVVEHRGEILAAYSNFEYIVEIAKTYFDYLWRSSK